MVIPQRTGNAAKTAITQFEEELTMIKNSIFNFGTVTVNNITIDPEKRGTEKREPGQKRPEDEYFTEGNELNFAGIHAVLQGLGKMDIDNERAVRKADYERRKKQEIRRKLLGDAYEFEAEEDASVQEDEMEAEGAKRPKPTELAEQTPIAVSPDGRCRVYENGYALVTALSSGRDQLVWVPDCRRVRYKFGDLTDAEMEYQSNYMILVFEADKDSTGKRKKVEASDRVTDGTGQPWYFAITETADNRDDSNAMNRGHDRKGKKVSADAKAGEGENTNTVAENAQARDRYRYASFPSGEEIMIRKETQKERMLEGRRLMKLLTQKQSEAFYLCNYYDMTEEEAGDVLGIKHQTVHDRIEGARRKIEKNRRNI